MSNGRQHSGYEIVPVAAGALQDLGDSAGGCYDVAVVVAAEHQQHFAELRRYRFEIGAHDARRLYRGRRTAG